MPISIVTHCCKAMSNGGESTPYRQLIIWGDMEETPDKSQTFESKQSEPSFFSPSDFFSQEFELFYLYV